MPDEWIAWQVARVIARRRRSDALTQEALQRSYLRIKESCELLNADVPRVWTAPGRNEGSARRDTANLIVRGATGN
ncbi:hypothetical protein [Bradyrhizobium embrapense]|uniref:hypothetical protein n=1 Tax=Bradyrhizobium embrapense TaxID=630921 RepID=UPI00067E0AAD|nr:hypothetical protein [Bradyrhizobium embrapense]